jgi:PAS domain S-box-containing protein
LATHRRADGQKLSVETKSQRIRLRGRDVWKVTIIDVTARLDLAHRIEQSERHYRDLVELSLGMVFTHDLEGRLESVNPAFARELGYSCEELAGRKLVEMIAPKGRSAFEQYLSEIVHRRSDSGSAFLVRKDGEERIWDYRNQVQTDEYGHVHVLCFALDVSARRRYERELRAITQKDPLTGCYNRRYL